MIKAVLIDIDNTILDWEACSHEAMIKAGIATNIKIDENFLNTYDRENPKLWEQLENNEITFAELKEKRFKIIFELTNTEGNIEEFEKQFKNNILESHIEMANARELLEYLFKKYKVFAASNSNLYQQKRRLANAELLDFFNDIFVSEELKAYKPNKEFFDEVFKRIPFKKEEVIMIGDSLSSDIKGANDYGIKSIWFNKSNIKSISNATYDVNNLLLIKEII